MDGIEVKPTQDDIIIAHQAKKIVFLEMRIAQLMQEKNTKLASDIDGVIKQVENLTPPPAL